MMRAIMGISSPLQTIGIALAVDVLVMQFDSRQNVFQLSNRTHDVRALTGMLLHDLEFLGGQCAGFLEHAIVHPDFSDVVKQGRDAQSVQFLGRKVELLADHDRVFGDAIGMAARVGIFFVDGRGEHTNGAQEELAVFLGGLLQTRDIAFDIAGHVVKGLRQFADFRGATYRERVRGILRG